MSPAPSLSTDLLSGRIQRFILSSSQASGILPHYSAERHTDLVRYRSYGHKKVCEHKWKTGWWVKRLQQGGKQLGLTWSWRLVFMSGAHGVELGLAHTWRMYSWHSAWYCQSHRLLPKNPPPPAPSSKSYTPVLWKEKKGRAHFEIWSWVILCDHMYVCQRWIQFYAVWTIYHAMRLQKHLV